MHAECRHIYTNRINVDQALKKRILEAYDNMYTSQLEDYMLQYASRSEINFQDPIETLFKQIEDGVRYANAGAQPYMEAQYVNIYVLLILNTGAIPDACRDWQRRTPMNQTWAESRRKFSRSQREQIIISSTARGAGYHTANLAERYEHTPVPADAEFVTAMANLATATSADLEIVATLTRSIATLTDQLKTKDIWAKSQEAEVRILLGVQGHTRPAAATSTPTTYVRNSYRTNNDKYCWSHGYQVGLNHTSANCIKKAPGHKDNTIKSNIMGGDTWGTEFL
jgi:hypothetical protein